jgi:hypothetical protein
MQYKKVMFFVFVGSHNFTIYLFYDKIVRQNKIQNIKVKWAKCTYIGRQTRILRNYSRTLILKYLPRQ